MKKLSFALLLIATCLFVACSNEAKHIDWVGSFTSEMGTTYELKADSTANIIFDDSVEYDSSWKEHVEDGIQFVTLEFSGNYEYYFLRENKLYRSKENMLNKKKGIKLKRNAE